jgi:hypothetical protein
MSNHLYGQQLFEYGIRDPTQRERVTPVNANKRGGQNVRRASGSYIIVYD